MLDPQLLASLVLGQTQQGTVRLVGFTATDNPATRTTDVTLGSGQGLNLAQASPTVATSGNTTLAAAEYVCPLILLGTVVLAGNATITFPNAKGFWIVDVSGITIGGNTLKFISGSTTSAALTPSTTNMLIFVSTYGGNTISVK